MAVQFGAVPLKTMLAMGNKVGFDEVALIDVEQFKVLSISLIVKANANDVSSLIVLLVIALMTGGSS